MMDSIETPGDHEQSDDSLFGDNPNLKGTPATNQNGSDMQPVENEGDDSYQAFVTLSPPTTPVSTEQDQGLNHSVLDSLENSASSSDIPKSKLDVDGCKLLDLESVVVPGRDRNIKGLIKEVGQDVDLKVAIKERLFHTVKSDTYVSYRICTDSTRPCHLFEQSHYEVWRRYRDFEWLQNILEKLHYTQITPPLPGKQVSRYFDHKSEQFLNEREKALDKFLKRIASHPYFSFDPHFKIFLTGDTPAFSAHMIQNTGHTIKLLESVTASVKNVTTSILLKNIDPEYLKQTKYFYDLGEKFGTMERVTMRLYSDREEMMSVMEDFSSTVIQWASHEPQLAQSLQSVGRCIEACGAATKDLNQSNAYSLLMSMREYQLFCTSGVNALRRRDALELEKNRTADDREKKKKLHDDAAAIGKIQKLPKLAEELQKASLTSEKALDDLSQANEMLRVDIEKWNQVKNMEICSVMKQVADDHIKFHEKSLDEWEDVLKMLKTIPKSASPAAEHRTDLFPVGGVSSQEMVGEDSEQISVAGPGNQVLPENKQINIDSLDNL